MVLATFRRFSRLMAAAVVQGGVVGINGARVLVRPPRAIALFICVNARWALS